MSELIKIQEEITKELADPQVFTSLVQTTFKGLDVKLVKRAIMEGMMRGFQFKDFLQKNVYAVPFSNTYSLVTSIDYARKIGMRSGVCGVSEPVFEEKDGKIMSCSITVKRKFPDYIGEYTSKVYFDEYSTGNNLWRSKPRTMIIKVAEMHALRKACPEELAKSYLEEEFHKEAKIIPPVKVDDYKKTLESAKNLDELKEVWAKLPAEAKKELKEFKEELKKKLTEKPNEDPKV